MIFVTATLLGFASAAPGGLGVFDAAMFVALWQYDRENLLAGLLLFRLLYYVVPFALALFSKENAAVFLAVFGLRMAGFACSVMTVKTPVAAALQYAMLFTGIGIGLWLIIAGVVVEPPAALLEAVNNTSARLARLLGRPATA